MPNRLSFEKSPYLQQHAHNPVDWYPWGEEAFNKAKTEDKPIFLSIGYSTCHWCHVMEHESFENPDIAKIMNDHFVNIKVDREERPDLDHVYMTTVQMLTGGGGWPMSVWLTPDLKPFYGGTYFPPDRRSGRAAFPDVLMEIHRAWTGERKKVSDSADHLTGALKSALERSADSESKPTEPVDALMNRAVQILKSNFDSTHGGFGRAPKFPLPSSLLFLLYYYQQTKNKKALEMVETTWRHLNAGGLTDQLAGGFARYSTDESWTVPHFEKMLYDNAQLAMVGVQLFQLTQDPVFRVQTEAALRYLVRDLRHPNGGFYSAEDADSEGKEGTFYLWTLGQMKAVLPEELFPLAVEFFSITPNGNFLDPHTQELGMNVLTLRSSKATDPAIQPQLERIKSLLLDHRNRRPRPLRDEKILTEWNGLAISALARAGRAFESDEWTSVAEAAVRFVRTHLWDPVSRELYRRWRDGERKILAFQSDYALLTAGLLDLFESTGNPEYLEWADELHRKMATLFSRDDGGYFSSRPSSDLLVRSSDFDDGVMPSGTAVAILNGVRLGRLLDREANALFISRTIQSMWPMAIEHPTGLLFFLMASHVHQRPPSELMVAGLDQPNTRPFFSLMARVSDPNISVISLPSGPVLDRLAKIIPAVAAAKAVDGRTTAYLCTNFSCQPPIVDPDLLARELFKG